MQTLTRLKLEQASRLVAESGLDAWIIFVRETVAGGDPVLPLILTGGLTWQSALLVGRSGARVAVVGNFDADPLCATGDWDEVVPYVQSIREPLLRVLERLAPPGDGRPRIGVNYSIDDPHADGLTHGMFLRLASYLEGTRFAGALESAAQVAAALRSRKIPEEVARVRRAIAATERIFAEIPDFAREGRSEREIYDLVQGQIDRRGFGYGWDRAGNPIVNSGPDSMIGHGVPSASIAVAPGHVVHLDLGVAVDGYSSDLQRCWYVPRGGEERLPEALRAAQAAVAGAIEAAAGALRPGVAGWQVDAAARAYLTGRGYPEYLHATGHQVGRLAHDGGGILGPRWERYGRMPELPVQEDQIYTLELGVTVPDHGYVGFEEMVLVTAGGCEWLSTPQREIPLIP
jgi:Xaa-Pro aminopeptidase